MLRIYLRERKSCLKEIDYRFKNFKEAKLVARGFCSEGNL